MSEESGQTVDPTAEITPEPSLREELARNLAEIQERDDTPAATPEKPAATPEAPASTPEKPVAAVAKPGETTTPAATTADAGKPKAPQSWSAAERAHWDKIPPEAQAVITKREEEAHRGITTLGQDAAFGKRLNEVITPYLPIIRAEGGNPEGAVRDLLQTAYAFRTNDANGRVALYRQLMRQYPVDVNQLVGQPQQGTVDPTIQALQQQLAAVTNHLNSQQQQQHQQVQASLQSQIQAFAADPKNEFFDKVRPVMATLLSGNVAKDMQEAYDMACNADPSVRSTIQDRAAAESEAKRAAEAKAKADAKRRASGSIIGSPGAAVPATTPQSNLSLRDELRAQLRAANS